MVVMQLWNDTETKDSQQSENQVTNDSSLPHTEIVATHTFSHNDSETILEDDKKEYEKDSRGDDDDTEGSLMLHDQYANLYPFSRFVKPQPNFPVI